MLWENVNEREMYEFSYCRSVNHKLTEHRSGSALQLFKKLITFKKGCTRGRAIQQYTDTQTQCARERETTKIMCKIDRKLHLLQLQLLLPT